MHILMSGHLFEGWLMMWSPLKFASDDKVEQRELFVLKRCNRLPQNPTEVISFVDKVLSQNKISVFTFSHPCPYK